MRIAIVESGGKQYRAVEGSTISLRKSFKNLRALCVLCGKDFLAFCTRI